MPFIRLGDSDRKRFGCEEWLPFDPDSVLTSEAEAFEDAGGELKFLIRSATVRWWRAMVWLALHRAGLPMKFDEIHFDMGPTQIEDRPGKAQVSGGDGSSTRRTSASSTGSRRRTSKGSS